jgi:hypothetical protein
MERRLYFVLGDLIACASTGATAALASALAIGSGWSAVLGVVVGMVIGMALALVLGLTIFLVLFGSLEVMLPAALSGILAGMWVGMAEPVAAIGTLQAATVGALTGLGVLIFTYGLNAYLRRSAGSWTS